MALRSEEVVSAHMIDPGPHLRYAECIPAACMRWLPEHLCLHPDVIGFATPQLDTKLAAQTPACPARTQLRYLWVLPGKIFDVIAFPHCRAGARRMTKVAASCLKAGTISDVTVALSLENTIRLSGAG